MQLGRRLIGVVSTSLALVLASGCSDGAAPEPSLVVTAALDRTEAAVGERVWLTMTVSNASDRALRVAGSILGFIEVRNEAGQVVEFGARGPFNMVLPPPIVLQPGEETEDSIAWASQVRGPDGTLAAPGVYHIRAAVPSPMPRSGGS